MNKKILILSVSYFPFVGGAEIAVKEITGRISGWRFDMLTARMDKKLPKFERIGNVNVYRIGFGFKTLDKYIFTFFGFFKAAALHLKNRYQLVWPIMAAYSSFAVLFKICFLKPKIVLTLQEGDPIEYITNLKRIKIFWPVFKFYFHSIDYVQTISAFLAKWAEDMGAKKEKIEVVPNGVDIEKFKIQNSPASPSEAGRAKFKTDELKQSLGIKNGEKVLITASRLVEKNAVGDIIEALKFLPENIKLLILGTGPEEESLKLKIKNLKLEGRVLMLGEINHDQLPLYLKISDVFVRPSLSEGLGNSFLEAMAAEVPVIGTAVGGIPDFLQDPSTSSGQTATGLFCEVKNPKSIAEKVKILLENGVLREKIVANAKKLVEEKYDWNLIAGKMGEIFARFSYKNH